MAEEAQSVTALIDFTTSKLQQLQQALTELQRHSTLTLNLNWKDLEQYFHGLEQSLKIKFEDLEKEEKEYEENVFETREMLEKREAWVAEKELSSLDRLQEKRDAVLSNLIKNFRNSPAAITEYPLCNSSPESIGEEKSDMTVAKSDVEDEVQMESNYKDEKSHSKLAELCEKMNVDELHKYISDNRKNLASIREEIPVALRSASNPFSLLLNSLKSFYSGDILGSEGKKDAGLLGVRRTCLMLMESLSSLMMDSDAVFTEQMLTDEIKEQAKAIAKSWKLKLDSLDINASSGNSLEAHAFLQLLATFDIYSDFDEGEICKLIPTVSRRRRTADLCRSLGILPKMPGIIDVLINSGRQIEAVNLAFAFELTYKYHPVPLLKLFLKEMRKVSQSKSGNMSPGTQDELNERELSALKSVIKCIEEHKLEEHHPLDTLQKRILQLEKAKADKRRAADAAKPQSKRPRASRGFQPPPRMAPSFPEKSFYRAPEPYHYTPYDQQYMYPPETHPLPLFGSATYTLSPPHATYYNNGYHIQCQPPAYRN